MPRVAADLQVLSYIPLVERIVHKVKRGLPREADTDGLLGAGMVGLLQAMDRFDPEKGVAFEAYATIRIRGAVQDELRSVDHLTRTQRHHAQAVHANPEAFAGDDVAMAGTPFSAPMSYDPFVLDDTITGTPWQEAVDIEEALAKRELIEHLKAALQSVPDRDRMVLSLYYEEELSLQEVGDILQVSPSRVSQLLSRSRARLLTQLSA